VITATGALAKMRATMASPVHYSLPVGDQQLDLADALQRKITLEFQGNIYCIQCGRKSKKSFQQGYCYPCLMRLHECNLCLLHPERCLVEQGKCPHDDWAHAHCHMEHVVYLANSSALKIGITRVSQVPTRWLDQGAMQGLPIFKTVNRYQAGIVEVAFKQVVSDKTAWQTMLKQDALEIDLEASRDALYQQIQRAVDELMIAHPGIEKTFNETPMHWHYPILQYPEKIKSLSLDKTPQVSGTLLGIKGQYLLLDSGVINVRKFAGYDVIASIL